MEVDNWQKQFYLYGDYMGDVNLTCAKCFNSEYMWEKGGSPTLDEVLDWSVRHKLEGCVAHNERKD